MRILTKLFTGIAIALLFSTNVFAQKNFLEEANKAFGNKEYFNSIDLYKKAYTKEKTKEGKAFIIFKTAESYRMIGDVKQEEAWYTKAIKAGYTDPKAVLYLADSKKSQEKYNEALIEYNNYKKLAPQDIKGENGAKSCELAQKWKDAPTRYVVENMSLINSKDPDFAPSYEDKKYTKLYFTSMRPGGQNSAIDPGIGTPFSDIFETQVDKNGKWSTPVALPEPVNTKDNEGLTALSRKGDLLIFARCVIEKKKEKLNQLWYTYKKGNVWNDPVKVEFCVDTIDYASPTLSPDGETMIFSSNQEGGQGDKDLWLSKFDKKEKKWGAPVNLGSTINTPGKEVFPFLHDDGTLYFSSDGHLGMGGWDIFKADKKGEDSWGNVTNMRYPINSAGDDFGIIFEDKAERGYLSSNREGTKGADDIWSFVLPPLLFTIEGTVTNCKFKQEAIPGVTMKLLGSDGSSVETKTDADGHYKFADNGGTRYVNANTSYVISTAVENKVVTKKGPGGFLSSSDKAKETTVGVNESRIFKHDFCLVPIEVEVYFANVFYELGKATLTQQAKDSLLGLVYILEDNPTFVIELSSHTDYRGSDIANQKLSEARAKSCVEFLIEKGINPARLVAKGYGEKRPVQVKDANGTVLYTLTEQYILKETKGKSKEEYEAIMALNRRTVFSVIRRDFVDPNAPKEPPKSEAQTDDKKNIESKPTESKDTTPKTPDGKPQGGNNEQ
jgi:peptidoglycan-associated lipoprotein